MPIVDKKRVVFGGNPPLARRRLHSTLQSLAQRQAKETMSQPKVTLCRRCRQSAADICLQMLRAGVLMQFEARCVLPISQVEIFRRPALVLRRRPSRNHESAVSLCTRRRHLPFLDGFRCARPLQMTVSFSTIFQLNFGCSAALQRCSQRWMLRAP